MKHEEWNSLTEGTRPLKTLLRKVVAQSIGKNKRQAVLFPAGKAFDVRTFLAHGVMTTKTKLSAICQDEQTAKEMWVSLFRMGMARKTMIHQTKAHRLSPQALTQSDNPIDFFFPDLCGPGTEEEITWIHSLVPYVTGPDSDVLCTLKLNHRGSGFFAKFNPTEEEYRTERKLIEGAPTTKVGLDGTIFNKKSTEKTLHAVAKIRAAFRRIFKGYNFVLRTLIYRDQDMTSGESRGSREMVLIHLSRFEKKDSILSWS